MSPNVPGIAAFEGKDEPIKKRQKRSTVWSKLRRCFYE